MILNIDTSCLKKEAEIKKLSSKKEDALDYLWSENWLKASLSKTDLDKASEIKEAAKKLRDENDLVVVVASGVVKEGIRALLPLKSLDAPEIILFGDTLSASDFAELIEKLEDKNFAIIAISLTEEDVAFKAAFSALRKLLIEKYGPQVAGEKLIPILSKDSAYMIEEMSQDQVELFLYPEGTLPIYCANTPAILFPMEVMGIDTSEFLQGFRDMIADPAWDLEGTKYALSKAIPSSKCEERVLSLQKETKGLARWMRALEREIGVHSSTLTWLYLSAEKTDIALPAFPGCSEDGSLNILLCEEIDKRFTCDNVDFDAVKITLPQLTPYCLGQFFAFAEMSTGISYFILRN